MFKFFYKNFIPLLIISIFTLITAQFFISNVKLLKIPTPGQDFEVFYLAGQQAIEKSNPYIMLGKDIVRNPPPALLLFMLLPLFPILKSQAVWFVISLLLFLVGSYFLFKTVAESDKGRFSNPLNWKLWLSYLSLVFVFFPFRYNLGSGQVNNLLFLLVVVTFYLIQRNRAVWSAFILALSIALKITPIFLLYTLFLQKKVKNILWTMLFLVLIGVVTTILIGSKVYNNYLAVSGSFLDFGITTYYNQSLAGFLSRAFNNLELTKWVVLLTTTTTSALLFIFYKKADKDSFLVNSVLWNLSIIYMLIFASFAWQYHFVIIIFPLVVTAYLGYKMRLSYKFFLPLALSYLLIGWNIKNPTIFMEGIIGAVIVSHVFFGSLLLLIINYYLASKVLK